MRAAATLRKGLVLIVIAAGFGWLSLPGGLRSTKGLTLVDMSGAPLSTLAGQRVSLVDVAAGKPMVVNLWATWCPPCRREMPVLAAAQQRESGVVFVFADQGEDAPTVQAYLDAERLAPGNVLLDPGRWLGQQAGTSALPVTLFFAADGRLAHSRIGEISDAALITQLDKLRPPRRSLSPAAAIRPPPPGSPPTTATAETP